MINLHSFRKSGSMCSVVGKNHGGTVVKPASVGPMGAGGQEAKRLRRSEAEAADPESDNGDVGSEGSSSTKGDKGRHSIGSRTLAKLYQCSRGGDTLLLFLVVFSF